MHMVHEKIEKLYNHHQIKKVFISDLLFGTEITHVDDLTPSDFPNSLLSSDKKG